MDPARPPDPERAAAATGRAGSASIREARPADFSQVAAITLAAYGPLVSGSYRATLADAAGRTEQATLLVAELDGRIAGTVTLVLEDGPWSELRGPDEAEFRLLAVDPAAQRHGVGTALVRACLERARAAGRRRMVLSTGRRMEQAQRLYTGLGFKRTPERDWSPVEGVHLLVYGLDLQGA